MAEALVAAQADLKNAKLNKVNDYFKSRYSSLAEVRDTVVPALQKHGLAITQFTDVADDGKRLVLVTRLMHKSGEYIDARFPIQHDKPQAMGAAVTYARRYALSNMCNIAADEDDDANITNPKIEEAKKNDGLVL